MKKFLFIAALVLGVLIQNTGTAQATVFTFTPNPSDLYGLDHTKAYSWGINQSLQPNEVIKEAWIEIKGINDWQIENNDRLYIDLFLKAPLGVRSYSDGEASGDYFTSRTFTELTFGTNLDIWTDDNEYSSQVQTGSRNIGTRRHPRLVPIYSTVWTNPAEDYYYAFNLSEIALLTQGIQNDANGNFGIGFDPDCHYYNDGITFKFRTETATPEPASMTLLGLGLLGIWKFGKKKS